MPRLSMIPTGKINQPLDIFENMRRVGNNCRLGGFSISVAQRQLDHYMYKYSELFVPDREEDDAWYPQDYFWDAYHYGTGEEFLPTRFT